MSWGDDLDLSARWERVEREPASSGLYAIEIIGVRRFGDQLLWKFGRSKNIKRRKSELTYFGNAIVRYVQLLPESILVDAERWMFASMPFSGTGAGREFVRASRAEIEAWIGLN